MIDHLVERYEVDPNAVDKYGESALHRAAEGGRIRTVQHMVEKHNADIRARNWTMRTALYLAERYGRTECASFLRGRGANV
jgi:ankyrin repeat protein